MKPLHTIDTLPALRAMADPLRKEILRELQAAPRTTAQLAARLGDKPTKLHYHIQELERNGLIELAETRMKGNLQEKYYRSVAECYRVDPRLFQEGPEAQEAFYDDVVGLLDRTALDVRKALQEGRMTANETSKSLISLLHLHLTEADVDELRRRLAELLEEFRERGRSEGDRVAALTLMFFPLAPHAALALRPGDEPANESALPEEGTESPSFPEDL
ncbi:MAG: helix-turn-helix domain-containing protein [Armatimonadetes bacterium]|nr:helix-turn-helix domain-containing protein [Armatimonadota bacterium]